MIAAGLDPGAPQPGTVSPQPTNKAAAALLQKKEELLIQMLIRHGEKIMCNVEDDDGNEQPLTVIDFIRYSLEQDGLCLRTPVFARILDEAIEHSTDEGFRASRYFENHPDETVSRISMSLAHDNETLSKIHSRIKAPVTDEERLVELLPHMMTDYKLAIVEDLISNLMAELRKPDVVADKVKFLALMKKIQDSKQTQRELARQCGDRVLQ